MEREILAKAAAWFAQETKVSPFVGDADMSGQVLGLGKRELAVITRRTR